MDIYALYLSTSCYITPLLSENFMALLVSDFIPPYMSLPLSYFWYRWMKTSLSLCLIFLASPHIRHYLTVEFTSLKIKVVTAHKMRRFYTYFYKYTSLSYTLIPSLYPNHRPSVIWIWFDWIPLHKTTLSSTSLLPRPRRLSHPLLL